MFNKLSPIDLFPGLFSPVRSFSLWTPNVLDKINFNWELVFELSDSCALILCFIILNNYQCELN